MKSIAQCPSYKNIILVVKSKPNWKRIGVLYLTPSINNLERLRIGRNILSVFEAFALGNFI
jgi:hypothetical protein